MLICFETDKSKLDRLDEWNLLDLTIKHYKYIPLSMASSSLS